MLKVGIVGTGAIARSHAAALRMLSGKVAMCSAHDTSNERLNDFILHYPSVSPCSSAQELLDDAQLELIVITTPPSTHEELIVTALKSGKYVLCEKPIAHTPDSASRIVEFAKKIRPVGYASITNYDLIDGIKSYYQPVRIIYWEISSQFA